VLLTVSDTGIGIEPALLSQVFDSFSQGDRTLVQISVHREVEEAPSNVVDADGIVLSVNTFGYTLTRLETFASWDTGRDGQEYTVAYSTVAAPNTFTTLAVVPPFENPVGRPVAGCWPSGGAEAS